MRSGSMVAAAVLVLGCSGVLVLGCSGVTSPSATTASATGPTPQASATVPGFPLEPALAGRPRPGDPSATLGASTSRGGLEPNVAYPFSLGHCGLASPFDLDGNLWEPVSAHDGSGGPLTEAHEGELINATAGTVTLVTPDLAEFRSPLGAIVTLVRLPGERAYPLCQ